METQQLPLIEEMPAIAPLVEATLKGSTQESQPNQLVDLFDLAALDTELPQYLDELADYEEAICDREYWARGNW